VNEADKRLLDPFPIDPGKRGPRAWNFYTFFATLAPGEIRSGWQGISMSRVRPGDIIAWRQPTMPFKGNTGHVVIVLSDAVPAERDGRKGVIIRVADSSGGRLENDTREAGQTGLGMGDMFFELDDLGRPVTVRTSGTLFHKKPIAAGRPVGRRDYAALARALDRKPTYLESTNDREKQARLSRERAVLWFSSSGSSRISSRTWRANRVAAAR
jgi:hypothetical protein